MAIPTKRVRFKRPDMINGATYRIKPSDDDTIYITINNAIHCEELRPVEIFFMTKDMKKFQYLSCLMRLISAALQQPGDFPQYIIDELLDTPDPMGGYYPGSGQIGHGKYVSGVVEHIGLVLQEHRHKSIHSFDPT